MNLARLPFCAIGIHQRDSRRTKHDGDSWQSECVGCGTPLTRIDGRWRQPSAPARGERNRALDAVRGIAILQVVAWHLVVPLVQKYVPLAGRALSLTWSGVDLFFVLSGFLIGGILIRNRGATNYFRVFYGRRVLRILPLYVVALVVFFVLWPEPFRLEYAFLVQNITWALNDSFGPGAIAMTWSLAVEEQFYLCLPLLIALCPPRRLPWVLGALAFAAPLVRVALHIAGLPHAAYLLLPARMDSLLLGALVAWAQINGRMPKASVLAGLAAATGLALIAMAFANLSELGPLMGTIGYSVIALFYAACLALIVTKRFVLPTWGRPLANVGLGAYSIYLFHSMIGSASYGLFGPHPLAFVGMAVGISVTAWVCWKLIEEPLIDFGHARFRYRAAPAVRAPKGSPAAGAGKTSA